MPDDTVTPATERRVAPKHPIDRGAPASVIADKFGGLAGLGKAIGKAPGTIHRWLVKGHIDGQYHDEINAAAVRLNIKIKPTDYVDTRKPEDRPQLAKADA